MDMSYGNAIELTKAENRAHTLKVLRERPSAREQLKLENMYDPKSGIHLGDKLWTNQQFSALKVYDNIDAKSGDIFEKILEREGTFDVFATETSSLFPIFSANNFDAIEKQLQRSAQNHYNSKGHRYTIQLLKQPSNNGIFGIQENNHQVRSIISCFKNTMQ